MIGWKVNVGYKLTTNTIKSLDDVTWTDTGVPFTIITSNNAGLISTDSVHFNSTNDAAISLEGIIGEDFYTIYGFRGSVNEQRDNLLSEVVPSIFKPYPIFNDSSNTHRFLVVHFISLNRLITIDPQSVPYMYVYSVSGKNLTYMTSDMSSSSFPWFNYIWSGSARILWIPGYSPSTDLTDPANYHNLSIEISPGSYGYRRVDFYSWQGNTLLTAIFGEGSIPDFEGGEPENPYDPIGPSGPGGGNGTFDDESDQIGIPSLPTLSSANTGFTRIYNPTLQQVQDLARYLWTDESVIQTLWNHIKQFFENPMDAIIGFNLVPVRVPDAGSKNFALMYIDTGVQMNVAANQFVDVDCGSFELKEYYGSALDYSPYTKISCFLPFIGTVSLNVDEVMGRTIAVKYRVDICSGSCVAYVTVDGNAIYQFSGHCAITIPLASADFSSYVNAAISVGKLIGAGFAAGASASAAAAMGGGEVAQQTGRVVTKETTTTARNPVTGRQITTGTVKTTTTTQEPSSQSTTDASFMGLSPESITNTVGQIMSSKPHIEHSGSFSGNSGYLGVRRPYLIIERPNLCMPEQYQSFNGFPAMMTLSLSECSGFTRIQQINPVGFSATNPELAEILQLLKSGVFL